ncbi:MAG TPA: hypothetical protein VFA34_09490 [Actinomycetota bacterium]|jgi:hypothetical protein|nr:hypothetical protein [Actinomycetota bacterium]
MKRHLGSILVGALVVGGIAYVGANELTRPESVALAQDSLDVPPGDEPQAQAQDQERTQRPKHPGLRRAIRGELVVPGETEGTFQNVRIDRGVVERVNGATVVIKEDDGTTVEIPTTDETAIRRDGENASVGDIKAGDHAMALRVEEATKRIRAFSPERWQEMEQRREQCRANPQECKRGPRGRRAAPEA